jgi:hypothetical protein
MPRAERASIARYAALVLCSCGTAGSNARAAPDTRFVVAPVDGPGAQSARSPASASMRAIAR